MILASFYERSQPAVSMRLNPNDSGSTISSPVQAQAYPEPQQPHQQFQPSASTPTGVLRKQGMLWDLFELSLALVCSLEFMGVSQHIHLRTT